MTDVEAIRAYRAAAGYRETILKSKIPRAIERDPEALEKITARLRVEVKVAELVMQQAEQAIEKLPRQKWQEAVRHRYLERMDLYHAGEVMFYSDRSVRRFERDAFAYLETGAEPPEGPQDDFTE